MTALRAANDDSFFLTAFDAHDRLEAAEAEADAQGDYDSASRFGVLTMLAELQLYAETYRLLLKTGSDRDTRACREALLDLCLTVPNLALFAFTPDSFFQDGDEDR